MDDDIQPAPVRRLPAGIRMAERQRANIARRDRLAARNRNRAEMSPDRPRLPASPPRQMSPNQERPESPALPPRRRRRLIRYPRNPMVLLRNRLAARPILNPASPIPQPSTPRSDRTSRSSRSWSTSRSRSRESSSGSSAPTPQRRAGLIPERWEPVNFEL